MHKVSGRTRFGTEQINERGHGVTRFHAALPQTPPVGSPRNGGRRTRWNGPEPLFDPGQGDLEVQHRLQRGLVREEIRGFRVGQ